MVFDRDGAAAGPAKGLAMANAFARGMQFGAWAPSAWYGVGFSWCSSSVVWRFGVSAGFGMTAEKWVENRC